MYSEILLDHFRNPRRVGSLEPPAITVTVENPICGDIMTLSAEVADGVIQDVRFRVRGCSAAIAAGSALTELLIGQPADAALQLAPISVEETLGGLPNESKHVARLACDAARALKEALDRSASETN